MGGPYNGRRQTHYAKTILVDMATLPSFLLSPEMAALPLDLKIGIYTFDADLSIWEWT